MVELASADHPDVLCLQEIPVWALPRMDNWSGMRSFGAVTRAPLWLGPVSTWVTRAHQGLFRSGLAGQANAILVAAQHEASDLGHEKISLDGRERRLVQAVRPRPRPRRRREPPRLERVPRPVGAAGRGRQRAHLRRVGGAAGRRDRPRGRLQRPLAGPRRLLEGGRGHRPRARAGCSSGGRDALGEGASNDRRGRALRPPSGRLRGGGRGGLTFEEARALFPVLERIAYLNAGTFGPLPRPVAEAMTAGSPAISPTAGRACPTSRRRSPPVTSSGCVRVARPRRAGAGRAHVVHERGMRDRAPWTRSRGGRRDRHDDRRALRPPRAARCVRRNGRRRAARARSHPRRGHAQDEAHRHVAGALDDRRRAPARGARERSGVPVLADGAQSVGAIPTTARGIDFLTISGQKWLCGPDATGALVVGDPDRLAMVSPSYFAQTRYEPDGSFAPTRARAGSTPAGGRRACSAGCSRRSRCARTGRTSGPPRRRPRCRALLDGRVELLTPPVPATLVAFRPEEEPAAVVERLHEGRRPRARAARARDRPGLVRLVDERRGSRPARRSARLGARRL